MFQVSQISFRKLQRVDFVLMHHWLNQPHVHAWYEKDAENSLEKVTKEKVWFKHVKTIQIPGEKYLTYLMEIQL